MTTDMRFESATNFTTRITNDNDTTTTESIENDDLGRTLAYAIPLACLAIVIVLLVVVGIRQRHRVMEKWISLKRMRNTNPKFHLTNGLRRDSEFDDSCNQEAIQTPANSQDYNLTTMF